MKLMVINFVAIMALSTKVLGHTVFTTLFVDDANQGDGTCVRMPRDPSNATFPINALDSRAMACGYDGTKGVGRVCSAPQSAKLSFQFRTTADGSEAGSLDVSHKGPCAVYMKRVDSAIKDKGIGGGWFKIWHEGYDSATSEWCSDKLIKNNGFLSVELPAELSGGYYLVRPELLSLQQADKSPPNPQFYVGCAQIYLDSKQHVLPQDTVSIPGYVSIKDPSVLFNIYTEKFPYVPPGPEPYASNSAKAHRPAITSQTEGELPEKAILVNANWWGMEVPLYTTEDGCLKSSEACWAQCTNCYNSAPPTGSKGCRIWEDKCTAIANTCNQKPFNGPPNAGKNLNPPVPVISGIPPAANDAAGSRHEAVGKASDAVTETNSQKLNPGSNQELGMHPSTATLAVPEFTRQTLTIQTVPLERRLHSVYSLSEHKDSTSTFALTIIPIETTPLTIIPIETSALTIIPIETTPLTIIPIDASQVSIIPINTANVSIMPIETSRVSTLPVGTTPLTVVPVITSTEDAGPGETRPPATPAVNMSSIISVNTTTRICESFKTKLPILPPFNTSATVLKPIAARVPVSGTTRSKPWFA